MKSRLKHLTGWLGAAALAVGLTSCAKDGKVVGDPVRKSGKVLALTEGEGAAALEDRFAFRKDDIKRDKDGNFVGGRRSQYDRKRNVSFGGGVGTASYRGTKQFETAEWSGKKSARTSPYAGKTDGSRFQTTSRFQGTSASQNAQRSRFEGTTARTSTYEAGKARESSAKRLEKPANAFTKYRKRVFSEPEVIPKSDYDKLTVDQYRSILGRE